MDRPIAKQSRISVLFGAPFATGIQTILMEVSAMVILNVVALAVLSGFAPQQKGPYPGWFTDTAQAFREARNTGKPLFIVFR